MLVTHCPECRTVFRVTEEILDQAAGQVRCGRCAHVFNGIEDLREQPDVPTQTIIPAADPDEREAYASDDEYDGGSTNWFLTDGPLVTDDADGAETRAAADADVTAAANADADADVTAAADADADADEIAPAAAPDADAKPETGAQANADAESDPVPAAEPTAADDPDWLPPLESPARRRWPWAVAASVLALLLAGQLVHVFRAELAGMPGVGTTLQSLYARLGIEVAQAVDLQQYELVNLAFSSEAGTAEQGWLLIEARLRNNGPDVQAFPQVFVVLRDRWQSPVAARYFEPEEYSASAYGDYARMPVGQVFDAQLIIADPGPEVTEYEVQICTRVAQEFICDGDEIFD